MALLFVLSAEGPSFAGIDDIRGADNTLWIALGAAQIDYAETSRAGANIDTEYGAIPALSGGFSYLDNYENIYLAMDAEGSWGGSALSRGHSGDRRVREQ